MGVHGAGVYGNFDIILDHFSPKKNIAPSRPPAAWYVLLGAHADRMRIAACDMML